MESKKAPVKSEVTGQSHSVGKKKVVTARMTAGQSYQLKLLKKRNQERIEERQDQLLDDSEASSRSGSSEFSIFTGTESGE